LWYPVRECNDNSPKTSNPRKGTETFLAPLPSDGSECPKTSNPRKGTETQSVLLDEICQSIRPKTSNPRKGTETCNTV